jgi:N-acetylmuramoyl-L-alanine amidase
VRKISQLVAVLVALLVLAAPAEAKRSKSGSASKRKSAAAAAKRAPAKAKAVSGFSTVVIDAGHGGHDVGGIPENIIPEKGVALDVAQRLQRLLEAAGLRTVMTRTDDTFIALGERVRIANAEADAIFVSVHFNSAPRLEARGVEAFYGSPTSAGLARLIQRNLLTVSVNPDHRPVRQASFWVLRKTKLRAVLAECGFLTNKEDTVLAQQEEHREKLASQIAAAILEWRKSLTGT